MEEVSYRNKKNDRIGIATTVLERIEPKVICTDTLELVEERELLLNELRLMTSAEDFEKYIADASLQELRELREELV